MGETITLHSRVLGARNSVTGWPNVSWLDSSTTAMVKRMSVMTRDTPAGTIEEVRGRLYTLTPINMDDEVTYDGVRWRVEDVQFKHILLGDLGYYDVGIILPRQMYPAPTIIPDEVDIFYPVMDPDTAVGAYPVISLANNATETVYHQIKFPQDFTAFISIKLIIISGATGNMRRQAGMKWGQTCVEEPDDGTATVPAGQAYMVNGEFTCIDMPILAGMATNDFVGIYFTRLGSHAEDTIEAPCYYCGAVMRYLR